MANNERRLSDAVNAENAPLIRKYKDNVDDKPVYERSSTWFRWVVLFFSCWAMFGSYYCYDNPTALQNKLMPKYNLSNIEYNLLYSVYSFPNMILPLFGGVFVDRFGAGKCLIVFLGFCVLGQLLFALASSLGWYWLMLVGRTVFGFGGESITVAETALLAVYFTGKEMAFAMGLNLSVARSGSSLNDVVSLILANEFNVPTALWFGFMLLLLCLFMSVILVYLDNRKCAQKTAEGFFVPQPQSGERVNFEDIKEFDRRYWLLTISCLVVYGCVLPWNNIGSNFISKKYGYSDSKANSRLLVPYLISAVLTPFIGYSVDRVGRRAELLLVSAMSLGLAHALFAFTEINPFVPLIILGIAYSIYASAIWPSISLVVNENKLGTAYGLVTAVQNSGLGLIPIIVGGLVGAYHGDNEKNKYIYAEMLFIGLALLGTVAGISLIIVDYKGEKKLASPSMKKASKQTSINDRLLDDN